MLEPAPEGMSRPLDPGTDLILNIHLQPSGKAETLRPVVGFYFTPEPPRSFPMLVQLEHDGALDIPPGMAGSESMGGKGWVVYSGGEKKLFALAV